MLIDTQPVSSWYVLNKGFKAYHRCHGCLSPRIVYFKVREPGFAGIMPKCEACGKIMTVRMKPNKIHPRRMEAVI